MRTVWTVAVGVTVAVLSTASPATAGADNPGSTASGGEAAVQGEVRLDGSQGEVRSSLKAVPRTRAHGFGEFGENDYRCREDWGKFC